MALNSFERNLNKVLDELEQLGFLTEKVYRTKVYLYPFSIKAHGYFLEKSGSFLKMLGLKSNSIVVPAYCFGEKIKSLRTLRHEYGHALASAHPKITVRNTAFKKVFNGSYYSSVAYDPLNDWDTYVSYYASTSPCEDFAETFEVYLACKGRIEQFRHRAGVYRKLKYIKSLKSKLRTNNITMVSFTE